MRILISILLILWTVSAMRIKTQSTQATVTANNTLGMAAEDIGENIGQAFDNLLSSVPEVSSAFNDAPLIAAQTGFNLLNSFENYDAADPLARIQQEIQQGAMGGMGGIPNMFNLNPMQQLAVDGQEILADIGEAAMDMVNAGAMVARPNVDQASQFMNNLIATAQQNTNPRQRTQ